MEDEVDALVVHDARFMLALALGLRQGETLGLQWSDIDLDSQVLTILKTRTRPRYEHGCGGHCGHKHGGHCPRRRLTRPPTDTPKSLAARRVVGLPDPLVALLRTHKASQAAERLGAGSLWSDEGWVFATEIGRVIKSRTDWDAWKAHSGQA